jgi:DNA-directed RNA polymerase omega subunit
MVDYNVDELVKKAGGRYSLVTLMQRRMRELQRGLPALVDRKPSLLDTAVDELMNAKLWLAVGEEADGLRSARVAELNARHPAPVVQPTLGPGKKPGL